LDSPRFLNKTSRALLNSLEIRQKVFQHILENAQSKEIATSCVNGYSDHIHVLLRLLPTQQLSKVVQLIKG
jgi:REP element-mobilizing transposase RayT